MRFTNHKSPITNLLRASVAPWFILLLALTACAQETAPLPTEVANAQKGKQVVMRSIAALGGDAYLKIFDYKQTGRGFGFHANESTGVGLPFTHYWQSPDKDLYTFLKNGEWKVLHIGDDSWETTFRGTRKMADKETADFNRRRIYSLDNILRKWAQDPKTQFFYEGTTLVGARMAHQVSLLNADNLSATLFIDQESYLPIQKQIRWRDPKLKMELEELNLYDEYRDVQSVKTPFKLTLMRQGEMASQSFLSKVEYNTGLGNSLFAIPQVNWDRTKK